eukprot:6064042-Amphidinium_carterae.1
MSIASQYYDSYGECKVHIVATGVEPSFNEARSNQWPQETPITIEYWTASVCNTNVGQKAKCYAVQLTHF